MLRSSNADGDTPLHLALRLAAGDRVDLVKLLLAQGANVTAKNRRMRTCLHEAAESCVLFVFFVARNYEALIRS